MKKKFLMPNLALSNNVSPSRRAFTACIWSSCTVWSWSKQWHCYRNQQSAPEELPTFSFGLPPPPPPLSLFLSEQVAQDCIGCNPTAAEGSGAELHCALYSRMGINTSTDVNNHTEIYFTLILLAKNKELLQHCCMHNMHEGRLSPQKEMKRKDKAE